MRGPDIIFDAAKQYLPTSKRKYAQTRFRRIIREYYVHAAKRQYDPETGMRADRRPIGERYRRTGGRIRREKVFLRQARGRGRPKNDAVETLVARLAIFWVSQVNKRPTISFRRLAQTPTQWELFVAEVLKHLGYFNARKYLERHSASV